MPGYSICGPEISYYTSGYSEVAKIQQHAIKCSYIKNPAWPIQYSGFGWCHIPIVYFRNCAGFILTKFFLLLTSQQVLSSEFPKHILFLRDTCASIVSLILLPCDSVWCAQTNVFSFSVPHKMPTAHLYFYTIVFHQCSRLKYWKVCPTLQDIVTYIC
jgi:hypothetical protein